MNNYTRNNVDFATGEVRADVRSTDSPSKKSMGLSYAHISPASMQFWLGGGLVKCNNSKVQGLQSKKNVWGTRSEITKFSRASRRRMMYKLATVKLADIPIFVTLTYPDEFIKDCARWKRDLDTFAKRLARRFPKSGFFWRMEFKRRLSGINEGKVAPHFHFLVWGVEYLKLLQYAYWTWYEIVGSGDERHLRACCRVEEIRSAKGSRFYASKYCAKESEEEFISEIKSMGQVGRFWGVRGADNIPWAECATILITDKKVFEVWRAFRRYAHLRMRSTAYGSRTIMCNDPYQWGKFIYRI